VLSRAVAQARRVRSESRSPAGISARDRPQAGSQTVARRASARLARNRSANDSANGARFSAGSVRRHHGRRRSLPSDRAGPQQRRYFSYDLLVESKDGSQALQVRIEPFSLSATELAEMQTELAEMQMVDPSWTPIPLLKYPLVPDVHAGDTVAIDLLENPTTGQKVGSEEGHLVFVRTRELLPEDQLSPARSHTMLLDSQRVARVSVDGLLGPCLTSRRSSL
jgi:hypothetical protein